MIDDLVREVQACRGGSNAVQAGQPLKNHADAQRGQVGRAARVEHRVACAQRKTVMALACQFDEDLGGLGFATAP
ncbi:hypothetical protein D3C72_1713070 [compost metagenome]